MDRCREPGHLFPARIAYLVVAGYDWGEPALSYK